MSLSGNYEPALPQDPGSLHLPTPNYCWRCGREKVPAMVPDPMQLKHDTVKLCMKCANEREDVKLRYDTEGSRIAIIVPDGD